VALFHSEIRGSDDAKVPPEEDGFPNIFSTTVDEEPRNTLAELAASFATPEEDLEEETICKEFDSPDHTPNFCPQVHTYTLMKEAAIFHSKTPSRPLPVLTRKQEQSYLIYAATRKAVLSDIRTLLGHIRPLDDVLWLCFEYAAAKDKHDFVDYFLTLTKESSSSRSSREPITNNGVIALVAKRYRLSDSMQAKLEERVGDEGIMGVLVDDLFFQDIGVGGYQDQEACTIMSEKIENRLSKRLLQTPQDEQFFLEAAVMNALQKGNYTLAELIYTSLNSSYATISQFVGDLAIFANFRCHRNTAFISHLKCEKGYTRAGQDAINFTFAVAAVEGDYPHFSALLDTKEGVIPQPDNIDEVSCLDISSILRSTLSIHPQAKGKASYETGLPTLDYIVYHSQFATLPYFKFLLQHRSQTLIDLTAYKLFCGDTLPTEHAAKLAVLCNPGDDKIKRISPFVINLLLLSAVESQQWDSFDVLIQYASRGAINYIFGTACLNVDKEAIEEFLACPLAYRPTNIQGLINFRYFSSTVMARLLEYTSPQVAAVTGITEVDDSKEDDSKGDEA
jgi:hypothetical protein